MYLINTILKKILNTLHNLSFNGMSMNLAKVIIEDYLVRNSPPKYLFSRDN